MPLHPIQESVIKHAAILEQHENRFDRIEERLESAESKHDSLASALTTLNLDVVNKLGEIKTEMTRTRYTATGAGALLAIDIVMRFIK